MSSATGGTSPTNSNPATSPTNTPTQPTNTQPTNTQPTNTPTNTTPPPNTSPPPVTTVTTAPSAPPSTSVVTSLVTQSPTPPGQTTVITTTQDTTTDNSQTTGTRSTSSPSASATSSGNQNKGSSSGLSSGGKTAIAVVIPIVVVAVLIIVGILLWRRRNRRKDDEEERRKEMEAYGYNPNQDPTLPPVGSEGVTDDSSGYRGWGPSGAVAAPHRKTSTNASSGAQYSDLGPGATAYTPASPTHATYDANTGEALSHNRHPTADSETIGQLGIGPTAGAAAAAGGIRRGPSNASSTYSAGDHSANSAGEQYHGAHELYSDSGYYQSGPYELQGNNGGQPIMRESPARRLTHVQEANYQPQHGGISRNF